MTDKMKILIAYDGSDCAAAALADLQRAGLPTEVEALVLSVDEHWLPVPTSYWMMRTSYASAHPVSEGVREMAKRATVCLQESFPTWEVRAEAHSGSPASIILAAAAEWKPDLLVVGSHGRTGVAQFMLGSISQKTLHQAPCSVRVARRRAVPVEAPLSLIIGVDGSAGAEEAVHAVAKRRWPAGTQVLLLAVAPPLPTDTGSRMTSSITEWLKTERARVQMSAGSLEAELRAAGLDVSSAIEVGDPKAVLLKAAERQGADTIFVGASGMSALDRFLLGSVSGALAARAACSVEIIRATKQ